jgi:hypothetical protein
MRTLGVDLASAAEHTAVSDRLVGELLERMQWLDAG